MPPGVFNLVQGDGPTTGNAISSHPDVEMVSFTGSTRAGIQVAIAAAPTVKRVHQELGGKSPNLVLPDADLATQLPAVAMGPLINTGQSCISPTKVLVAKDREAEVVAFYKAMYSATPVGDPMAEGQHLGPVVNKAQYDKVKSLIQSAIDEGATLETGGTDLPANVNRGYFIQPTVFSGVTPNMRIAQEEIFGPVATIITYDPWIRDRTGQLHRIRPVRRDHRRSGPGRRRRAEAARRHGRDQQLGPQPWRPVRRLQAKRQRPRRRPCRPEGLHGNEVDLRPAGLIRTA